MYVMANISISDLVQSALKPGHHHYYLMMMSFIYSLLALKSIGRLLRAVFHISVAGKAHSTSEACYGNACFNNARRFIVVSLFEPT